MKLLNAQQLAFILDIKKEDARIKMCNAWEKHKGIPKKGVTLNAVSREVITKKIIDQYPQAMPVDIISNHLNLPTLEASIIDIQENYLIRPASKKWILYDYPEKKIKSAESEGKEYPIKIDLPPGLKSLLPPETIKAVYQSWLGSFTDNKFKSKLKVPNG